MRRSLIAGGQLSSIRCALGNYDNFAVASGNFSNITRSEVEKNKDLFTMLCWLKYIGFRTPMDRGSAAKNPMPKRVPGYVPAKDVEGAVVERSESRKMERLNVMRKSDSKLIEAIEAEEKRIEAMNHEWLLTGTIFSKGNQAGDVPRESGETESGPVLPVQLITEADLFGDDGASVNKAGRASAAPWVEEKDDEGKDDAIVVQEKDDKEEDDAMMVPAAATAAAVPSPVVPSPVVPSPVVALGQTPAEHQFQLAPFVPPQSDQAHSGVRGKGQGGQRGARGGKAGKGQGRGRAVAAKGKAKQNTKRNRSQGGSCKDEDIKKDKAPRRDSDDPDGASPSRFQMHVFGAVVNIHVGGNR